MTPQDERIKELEANKAWPEVVECRIGWDASAMKWVRAGEHNEADLQDVGILLAVPLIHHVAKVKKLGECDIEARAAFRYQENFELRFQLTEAQAEIERLRGALGKVARADCPTYIAHPQSVWWNEHVVSKAAEALAGGKDDGGGV